MWHIALYLLILWTLCAPILIYGQLLNFPLAQRFQSLFVSGYCVFVLVVFTYFTSQSLAAAGLVALLAVGPLCLVAGRSFKSSDAKQ